MEKAKENIVKLKHNTIMEYDWGSPDQNCLVSQLRKQPHKRYAQLWMGTHPRGPSKLSQQQTLQDYLTKNGFHSLPFLFKVLCVQGALSIQLHPNKQQAEKLHAQQPKVYVDDNDKPQMFFTVTQFQGLIGIVNFQDLQKLFTIEPYSKLQSKETNTIKDIIRELISFGQAQRKEQIDLLLNNIGSIFPERINYLNALQEQFPDDVGILVSSFLKYRKIPPGQCFALEAGVPHSYFRGTLVEIMKNSDNVVRLGLTPKLKDVKTMLEIMNDQIDLDPLKVQRTPSGYIWQYLVLNPVQVKDEVIEIHIAYSSLGIVFQGVFSCETFKLNTPKGEVFYIQAGKYKVKGPFLVHFGGYAYQ